ncbi:MAG TPA: hypothetical protein VIN58_06255 [Roseateles sp.]
MSSRPDSLVFAFLEDGTLEVFLSTAAAATAFEGVDVGAGTVTFYDAQARPLEACFTSPNGRWGTFVSPGGYELQLATHGDTGAFTGALERTLAMEPNEWFATLDEIKRTLRSGP